MIEKVHSNLQFEMVNQKSEIEVYIKKAEEAFIARNKAE